MICLSYGRLCLEQGPVTYFFETWDRKKFEKSGAMIFLVLSCIIDAVVPIVGCTIVSLVMNMGS